MMQKCAKFACADTLMFVYYKKIQNICNQFFYYLHFDIFTYQNVDLKSSLTQCLPYFLLVFQQV